MPKIKHDRLKNTTAYGKASQITFDANGHAEVSEEDLQYLVRIPGYSVVPTTDPNQLDLFDSAKNPPGASLEPGPSIVVASGPPVEITSGDKVPDITPPEGSQRQPGKKKWRDTQVISKEPPKNDA